MADSNEELSIKIIKEHEEIENASSLELHKQQSEDKTVNSHHLDSEYDTANYDSSDGDGEESLEDEDISSVGSEEEKEDEEKERCDGQEQIDFMKKVDEDRSNPQYIPKKGTFYEHDDRTTEDSETIDTNLVENTESSEINPKSVTPTISSASKTMKKWQPASVGRWSHDRFEETEQAPKSRLELVSAYGYDIRNEDGPPRARRRRRYGRGPTKYSRNWEDESAYIKANNIQRKQLRPQDFPVLGDRKILVKSLRNLKEEKENHCENRKSSDDGSSNRPDEVGQNDGRNNLNGNRKSVDFHNRNRSKYDGNKRNQHYRQIENCVGSDSNTQYEDLKSQMETLNFINTKIKSGGDSKISAQQQQKQQIKNNDCHNNGYENFNSKQDHKTLELRSGTNVNSKLIARIQHVQQRNDPSHVGSVQMHSLVSPQHASDQYHSTVLEQGKPKRYSDLRQRPSTDTSVIQQGPENEKKNIQQIHMQNDASPHQPQHILLYHPDQLHIQNLTKTGPPPQTFQQNPVQPQYPPPGSAYFSGPLNEYDPGSEISSAPIIQLTATTATAYMQQQQTPTTPQITNPQPSPTLNYVTPTGPPNTAATYKNYPSPTSQYPNYNTVGGTTYFVPHAQTSQRTNALPQRRPTNAIPILAPPSDKGKQLIDQNEIGSVENIDHILDNMFVQRQPYVPPQVASPVGIITDTVEPGVEALSTDNRINDAFKNIQITDFDKAQISDILCNSKLEVHVITEDEKSIDLGG